MTLRTASRSLADLPFHLVEEISHRVVNEYAEAISSLSLAAVRDPEGDGRAALARAAERLRAHAKAHRALLPPADGQVNLADYIGRLCASLSSASLAERRIHLTVEADEIWLSSARAWRFGLAIAELVRNAARHGLAGGCGAISVHLVEREGRILAAVRDNGRPPAAIRTGRGLRLVRALATELGGSADWRFDEGGCVARLHAPVDPAPS